MKRLLVAALVLLSAVTVQADQVSIHIASHHVPAYDYNNSNLGYYVLQSDGLAYGSFMNSYSRRSAYIGKMIRFGSTDVLFGVANGYPGKQVMPVIAPSMRFNIDGRSGFRLAILPAISNDKPAMVLHIAFETRFGG